MKTSIKEFYLIFLATLLMADLSSCSVKSHFQPSPVVPGAEGFASVKKDKNKNYKIKVELVNIAEPGKLDPPKDNYIVWMESADRKISNLGQVKISSNAITHSLKASLETVTPLKPKKIFITPEDKTDLTSPRSPVVLTTKKLK